MKTFSAYVMYNDGTSQEAHNLHTIRYIGNSTATISIEDAIKDQLAVPNIVAIYGDDELLIIKGNYKSVRFWNK